MKIAVVHFDQDTGEDASPAAFEAAIDDNERRLLRVAAEAAAQGAALIVLPELPSVPARRGPLPPRYSSRAADVAAQRERVWWLAKTRGPRFVETLRRQVVEELGCHVATSTLTALPGHHLLYATGILLSPGGAQHIHHKRFLTGDSIYAARGASPLTPAALRQGDADAKVGLLVCADYSVPLLVRALALGGSELIVVPAQLGAYQDSIVRSLVVRARENGVPLALANCFARDAGYQGEQSAIVGADGRVLAQANGDTGEVLWADLDPHDSLALKLRNERLANRRPALYQGALLDLTSRQFKCAPESGTAAPISRLRVVTVSGEALWWSDLEQRIAAEAALAARNGAPLLLVLPEFAGPRSEAQPALDLARRHSAYAACGCVEAGQKVLVLEDPTGAELLRYTKVHLTTFEQETLAAGTALESYVDVPPDASGDTARLGLLSADDLLVPEAVEIQRNAGVDLLLVPSALDFEGSGVFDDVAKSRAVSVAAADLRHRGGIFGRYPDPFETPLEANGSFLNVLEFEVRSHTPRVMPIERAGLECLVRLHDRPETGDEPSGRATPK